MKRSFAVVLVVITVSVIVAMGASDFGLLLPAMSMDGKWVLALRLAGIGAAAGGLIVLLMQRTRLPARGDRAADPTAAVLAAAATIMTVLAILALLSPRMTIDEFVERSPRTEVGPDSANGEAGASAALLPQAGDPGGRGGGQGQRGRGGRRGEPEDQADNPADIDLGNPLSRLGDTLLMILLFIVAIVVSIALAGRFGARREEEAGETAALAAEDAEAMLRASLGAFDYDGDDPRLQITAAYHRLLVALADAGAPREPQEAPHEYLYRALGPLGVRPAPMHRLTELYVIAQFSELPITTDHRADAIAALEEGLRDLHARTGAGDGEAAALT